MLALTTILPPTRIFALRPLRLQRPLSMHGPPLCELAHKRGGPQRQFATRTERSEVRGAALGRATEGSEAGAAERARAVELRLKGNHSFSFPFPSPAIS